MIDPLTDLTRMTAAERAQLKLEEARQRRRTPLEVAVTDLLSDLLHAAEASVQRRAAFFHDPEESPYDIYCSASEQPTLVVKTPEELAADYKTGPRFCQDPECEAPAEFTVELIDDRETDPQLHACRVHLCAAHWKKVTQPEDRTGWPQWLVYVNPAGVVHHLPKGPAEACPSLTFSPWALSSPYTMP